MTASKATAASELAAMRLEQLGLSAALAERIRDRDELAAILAELRRREERERSLREAARDALPWVTAENHADALRAALAEYKEPNDDLNR